MGTDGTSRRDALLRKIAEKKASVRRDEKRFRNWFRAFSWGAILLGALIAFISGTDVLAQGTKNTVVAVLGIANALFTAFATNAGLESKWNEEGARRSELEELEVLMTNPGADLDVIESRLIGIVGSDRPGARQQDKG